FFQHKIDFEVDETVVPQLNKDYKKGYDRLTNGFMITQFVGYAFFDAKKRINLYAGFEFSQAFTQNRRPWNFDQFLQDDTKRVDLLSGFRIGWILPLYPKSTEQFFYY